MHALMGSFHRDDMAGALVVQATMMRQRRGLARTGRAGDQHEAFLARGKAKNLFGNVVVGRIGEEWDDADDCTERTALAKMPARKRLMPAMANDKSSSVPVVHKMLHAAPGNF